MGVARSGLLAWVVCEERLVAGGWAREWRRPSWLWVCVFYVFYLGVFLFYFCVRLNSFSRPGNDLLSRVLRQSTIGAEAFNGRVRNGFGCFHFAIATRSAKTIFMRSC